jgi:serine/threonine protein kinase
MEKTCLRKLLKEVKSRSKFFPEEQVRRLAAGIVDGMRHLHANNFIHRDLKAENILVATENWCRITLVIT